MFSLYSCFLLLAFAGITLAYAGQYIPRSFYVIDREGHKSDVVYIRNRRDILEPLIRMRRGSGGEGNGGQASSSAQAGASANAGATSGAGAGGTGGAGIPGFPGGTGGAGIPGFPGGFPGPGGFPPGFNGHDYSNPSAFLDQLSHFASSFPAAFGGPGAGGGHGDGRSFATSGSYASGGGAGTGSGTGYSTGGGTNGHDGRQAGYDGPILFSRFGETEGQGAHVSASAEGPHAAFSSSSTSVDGDGKVKYSVKSGKY